MTATPAENDDVDADVWSEAIHNALSDPDRVLAVNEAWGLGFRVYRSGFRVSGLGLGLPKS